MALNKIIVVKETDNKISVGLPIQQETLDSVTDRGNTTNNSITVSGLFSNGNVGIGTNPSAARLTIAGNGSGTAKIGDLFGSNSYTGISLNNTNVSSEYNLLSSPIDQDLYINRPSGAKIRFREQNSNDQLTIAANGNVGIGTTNPQMELDVSGQAIIRGPLEVTRPDDNIRIIYRSYNLKNSEQLFLLHGVQAWVIGQDGSDNNFKIASADTTFASSDVRLSISTNGNVGIGTASPSAKLHVSGDVRLDGQNTAAPSNTSTPVAWFSININGTSYKMPLYQ